MAKAAAVKHGTRYEYVKKYYGAGVTKEQAKRYVKLNMGVLFDWEYEEITGEPYEEA